MKRALVLVLAAGLCACGRSEPVAQEAKNGSSLPDVNTVSPSPTGGPPSENSTTTNTTATAAGVIPPALHGRWGLTPADCTQAAAEGQLVIDGNELRFYESVAVPTAGVVTSAESIGGDFNFTGEGQSWSKYQSLRVKGGLLTRTERGPVASFRYVRCD